MSPEALYLVLVLVPVLVLVLVPVPVLVLVLVLVPVPVPVLELELELVLVLVLRWMTSHHSPLPLRLTGLHPQHRPEWWRRQSRPLRQPLSPYLTTTRRYHDYLPRVPARPTRFPPEMEHKRLLRLRLECTQSTDLTRPDPAGCCRFRYKNCQQ